MDRVEKHCGGIVPSCVVDKMMGRETKAKKKAKAREQMLVVMFMEGTNWGFRPLVREMESGHTLGNNKVYPETMHDALEVMMVFKERPLYKKIIKKLLQAKKSGGKLDEDETMEAQFTQMSKATKRKKGLCFQCGKKWYRGHECAVEETKEEEVEGTQHVQQVATQSHGEDQVDFFLAWNI